MENTKFYKPNIFVIILLLTAILLVRITGTFLKLDNTHDEVISFIAATGHQETYSKVVQTKKYPYGQIASIIDWKKLWSLEDKYIFSKIQNDLLNHDLHPPFYFWLLHVFITFVNVHTWAGPLLNLMIDICSGIILFLLAKRILKSKVKAFYSLVIWSFIPSTLDTFLCTRQYSLFVFCVLLLIYNLSLFMEYDSISVKNCLAIGLSIIFGMLTLYYFIFIILGCGLWLLLVFFKENKQKFFISIGLATFSILIVLLIHPLYFTHIVSTAPLTENSISLQTFRFRFTMLFLFFMPHRIINILQTKLQITSFMTIGFFLIFSGSIIVFIRFKKKITQTFKNLSISNKFYLFIILWIFFYNAVLYLGFISPEHAMTGRYLSMINPFLAILIVRLLFKKKLFRILFFIIIIMGSSFILAEIIYGHYSLGKNYKNIISDKKLVILDTVKRGYLPRFLWYLPNNMNVIAGDDNNLISSFNSWKSHIDRSTIYLNNQSINLAAFIGDNSTIKVIKHSNKMFFSRYLYFFEN